MWLGKAAPNPMRGSTAIRFGLPQAVRVDLAVYDQAGRRVRQLASGPMSAGEYSVAWDARDNVGRALPSGLYFYRLQTELGTLAGSIVVLR